MLGRRMEVGAGLTAQLAMRMGRPRRDAEAGQAMLLIWIGECEIVRA